MAGTGTDTEQDFLSGLMKTVYGFQSSQVIFSAVKVGIFDFIESAGDKTCTAKELASQLNLHENSAERVMRMCVNLGLLKLETSQGPDSFRNSELTCKFLVSSSPTSMVNFVKRFETQYTTIRSLTDVLEKGQTAVVAVDNASNGQVCVKKMEYNRCMMKLAGPSLATIFDLSSFTSVCDLAGGVGELAHALKQAYPSVRASVLDQPGVVDYAMGKGYNKNDKGDPDVHFIKGDIMRSVLPEVDLFTMAHACMFFNDEELKYLFVRIHAALPRGGALMLCESILNEDKSGPLLIVHRDIALQVMTHGGERSFSEYKAVLQQAGFTDVKCHKFGRYIFYDVILASTSS